MKTQIKSLNSNKSLNVQLLEALNDYYLKSNYSPNPITCQLQAAETLLKVLDPSSWNCALCSNDMTTEYCGDQIKLCHACYCDLMERAN